MSIRLEVVTADALDYAADALALKFAQASLGVDAMVVNRLRRKGIGFDVSLPAKGESLLIRSEQAVSAAEVLFVGVEPLGKFDYGEIRLFGRSVLTILGKTRPHVKHVAMTLHGTGFGLDEAEAFRAELAGVLDAVHAGAQRTEV